MLPASGRDGWAAQSQSEDKGRSGGAESGKQGSEHKRRENKIPSVLAVSSRPGSGEACFLIFAEPR